MRIATLLLLLATQCLVAMELEQYRWKNRPLLVFAADPDNERLTEFRETWKAVEKGTADRDMLILEFIGLDKGKDLRKKYR